jgi:hypothetical protein
MSDIDTTDASVAEDSFDSVEGFDSDDYVADENTPFDSDVDDSSGFVSESEPVEALFELDGTPITLDEARNGYLRQSDYTKKTQELAEMRQRLADAEAITEALRSDPANTLKALGDAFGKQQVEAQTPLSMAQHWVLANDPQFDEKTSTFTTSDTRHVDAAFEYCFNTLAMINDPSTPEPKRGQKSYIVLPNFLPTSATSFDRFAGQVSNIIRHMPNVSEKVLISTYHPEHCDGGTRSPVPIFVVTWK